MRPILLAVAALALCSLQVFSSETTSLVEAWTPDAASLAAINRAGIDMTELRGKPGGWIRFPASERAVRSLRSSGLTFRILIQNMEEEHAAQVRSLGPVNALGFGNGSMGGHYTYAEMARQLDTMKLLYPDLITSKMVIGSTFRGRPIFAVKISDNPDVQEDEPEVLYTALIHAREPAGMMSVIYYMWHLLTHYGTDPEATYLVNNRQIWFVPIVNVDGYEYNRKFYPSGGGMRRKNLRNVDTLTYQQAAYGIDLNRNFGTHEMWNSPYGGSSDDPFDDTYRGTLEWSEPETAVLRDLAYAHTFKAALNYHTWGEYLIYPWGYQPFETRDSLLFREYSGDMVRFNGYLPGRSTQTVGYTVRGCSDDFFYGDPAKPKVFSMTPEVGDRFWALPQDILPFALQNLGPNLYITRIAGSALFPALHTVADANGNGFLERGEDFIFYAGVRNKGLADASSVSIELIPSAGGIVVHTGPVAVGALPSQGTTQGAFQCSVAPNAVTGVPASLYLRLTDASGSITTDTIRLVLGIPTLSFVDSARTLGNWTPQAPWGLISTSHTPPSSFTDSPAGNYASSIDKSLTLTQGLSLMGASTATLTFWTRWDIESNYDFARVEVSTNNGTSWGSLRGRYTRRGSGNAGAQPDTAFGFDGKQLTWVEESMDLTPYVNRTIKLRLRLTTDGSVVKDGWYVDDIRLTAYTPNYDTSFVLVPSSLTLSGIAGSRLDAPITLWNFTGSPVTFALSESLLTTAPDVASPGGGGRLPALRAFFDHLPPAGTPVMPPPSPSGELTFITAATDLRGDNLPGGVDILDLAYQKRTSIVGPVLDLRVRMLNPDSAVAGFLSLDTDQDFGTGFWPVPWGLGPRTRDIGSEFEVLVDASGAIADSLGFGANPIAVIFRTGDTSVVYLPIIPSVTRDSVLTITISGIPFGALGLDDPDQNLAVGATFARWNLAAAFPDFAPNVGHGLVGEETGISWMRQSVSSLQVPAGDSASVFLSVLGATPPGTSHARLRFQAAGQPPLALPVTMTVTGPGSASITLSTTTLSDTLAPGDSTTHAVTVGNTGTIDLIWGVLDTSSTPWVAYEPNGGILLPGSSTDMTVTLRTAGLPPGATYQSHLLIVSNAIGAGAIPFSITLVVEPSTAVVTPAGLLPDDYALGQNYPNPFNGRTMISFAIPAQSSRQATTLQVYDLLGRRVATLVDEVRSPGNHTVSFDAGGLASGTYIYRLTSGGFTAVRRLVLLK